MECKKNKLTLKALVGRGCNIAPTEWTLQDSEIPLYCEEVVRMIPNKRLVAFGEWGNQKVVIKLFFEKGEAKKDAVRDATGVLALMECNVPTPKLLYQGSEDKKRIYILIFERIMEAESFLNIWQNKKNPEELIPLLRALIVEIATQHVLGILQKDLHLNNFLVTEKCIYTLDGGQISKIYHPLDEERSIEYLALLLAQLGVGMLEIQIDLFKYYAKLRGWLLKPKDIARFKKKLLRQTEDRSIRYRKKVFRSCTQIQRIDKMTRTILYDRNYAAPEFLKFLENPDKIFENPNIVFLKQGRSSTVVKAVLDNRVLVIKRYNLKNSWHRLRRLFRNTRASVSWCMSQHLFASGIKTAKPVACIENRFLGFRGTSYFVMEYIDGPHIGEYFREFSHDNNALAAMAQSMKILIANLSELRITHGDLKMTNILVKNHIPYLIDLDGISEHSTQKSLRIAMLNEIQRFMRNWEQSPPVLAMFKNEFYEKN